MNCLGTSRSSDTVVNNFLYLYDLYYFKIFFILGCRLLLIWLKVCMQSLLIGMSKCLIGKQIHLLIQLSACCNLSVFVNFVFLKAYQIIVSFSTAISEDLGQVEYILSDKTGTLTENKMILKRCCISDTLYGNDNGDALNGCPLTHYVLYILLRDNVYPFLFSIQQGLI